MNPILQAQQSPKNITIDVCCAEAIITIFSSKYYWSTWNTFLRLQLRNIITPCVRVWYTSPPLPSHLFQLVANHDAALSRLCITGTREPWPFTAATFLWSFLKPIPLYNQHHHSSLSTPSDWLAGWICTPYRCLHLYRTMKWSSRWVTVSIWFAFLFLTMWFSMW